MLLLRHGWACRTATWRVSLRVDRRCLTVSHAALRDGGNTTEGDSRLRETDSSDENSAAGASKHAEKLSKFGDIRLDKYGKVIEDDYAIFRDQYRR